MRPAISCFSNVRDVNICMQQQCIRKLTTRGAVKFENYERLKTVIDNITSVQHGNIYAEAPGCGLLLRMIAIIW